MNTQSAYGEHAGRWLGPNEGTIVATQVTMDDGTESPLADHMRDAHQKGTTGYTDQYLADLHRNLHQRNREPEEELEHQHPEAVGWNAGADDAETSEEQRTSRGANGKHGKHRKTRT